MVTCVSFSWWHVRTYILSSIDDITGAFIGLLVWVNGDVSSTISFLSFSLCRLFFLLQQLWRGREREREMIDIGEGVGCMIWAFYLHSCCQVKDKLTHSQEWVSTLATTHCHSLSCNYQQYLTTPISYMYHVPASSYNTALGDILHK